MLGKKELVNCESEIIKNVWFFVSISWKIPIDLDLEQERAQAQDLRVGFALDDEHESFVGPMPSFVQPVVVLVLLRCRSVPQGAGDGRRRSNWEAGR